MCALAQVRQQSQTSFRFWRPISLTVLSLSLPLLLGQTTWGLSFNIFFTILIVLIYLQTMLVFKVIAQIFWSEFAFIRIQKGWFYGDKWCWWRIRNSPFITRQVALKQAKDGARERVTKSPPPIKSSIHAQFNTHCSLSQVGTRDKSGCGLYIVFTRSMERIFFRHIQGGMIIFEEKRINA